MKDNVIHSLGNDIYFKITKYRDINEFTFYGNLT